MLPRVCRAVTFDNAEPVPDNPPMYVREEAMDDVGAIIEGLEGCVAHAQRIGDEAEFDDEPRAFLDAVCAAVHSLGSFKA